MKGNRNAIAALLAVQVLFGTWPIAAKKVLPSLDPLPLTSVRVIAAAALLWVVTKQFVKTGHLPFRAHAKQLLALAFLGVVLNQTLFVLGLARTTAVNASLLITTIPVFTYAIAVALGREKLGPRRTVGIGLALVGALYIVGLSRIDSGWHTAVGDLMILGNALAFSFYLVLVKPLNERYHPLSVTMWTFVVGAVAFFPFIWAPVMWQNATVSTIAFDVSPAVWGWLAYIIVGPSVLTYVLNAVALRQVAASTVAVFIYIQPVLTALFAWWLLDEDTTWRLLPAAVLVFIGVWTVARKRSPILQTGDVTME